MLLLIEVSDSSLRHGLEVKVPLYAGHGIAEVWIIDVVRREFHTFDSPQPDGYALHSMTPTPGAGALKAFPEMQLDLTGLLRDL